MGKNWNSKTKLWTEIKSTEKQDLANKAKKLRIQGCSVSEIAKSFGLSKSRIYQYLN
tara:strand:+ start:918 stop:1088 length:171 start_codon:yes stop_codon:yes gene_type:complete